MVYTLTSGGISESLRRNLIREVEEVIRGRDGKL